MLSLRKEGVQMATKSFLKSVNLHGKRDCQNFIRALEKSESPVHSKVEHNHVQVRNMDRENIRKMFGAEETEWKDSGK